MTVHDCRCGCACGAAGVSFSLSPVDLQKLVKHTDGYSGSDMKNLIQEACQVRNPSKDS